ncbi:MAG: ATP-binding cassette domain-containing protein [Planctomycetaceae bacterium]|nr:ATP-binding cassette domain-containing protein [Planctomycetaceae bacterium]
MEFPAPDTPRLVADGLRIHRLDKVFETHNQTVHAVQSVSFSVEPGQVFGLLGPNGAGKTTTLRMILGLIPPDSGYAEVDGLRSDRNPDQIKQRIGFVSANTGLYPWLTVAETLRFFASIYGAPADLTEIRLNELADKLAMTDFLDRRCGVLSTGQTQRVNLAKALIHDPPVMLLDEPTLGLDVLGSQVVFDYLELLKQRGCAVILSTHRLEQAQRVCDVLGLMHQGQMRLHGTWTEIARQTGYASLVDIFLAWGRGATDPAKRPISNSLTSDVAD